MYNENNTNWIMVNELGYTLQHLTYIFVIKWSTGWQLIWANRKKRKWEVKFMKIIYIYIFACCFFFSIIILWILFRKAKAKHQIVKKSPTKRILSLICGCRFNTLEIYQMCVQFHCTFYYECCFAFSSPIVFTFFSFFFLINCNLVPFGSF